MNRTTVLARVGGFARVRLVVEEFYDRVLDCPPLQRHFADVDMARLVDHQTKLIAGLMAGGEVIDDGHLQRAHQRLRITGPEFDTLHQLLRDVLEAFDYETGDVEFICGEFAQRRRLVVSAP